MMNVCVFLLVLKPFFMQGDQLFTPYFQNRKYFFLFLFFTSMCMCGVHCPINKEEKFYNKRLENCGQEGGDLTIIFKSHFQEQRTTLNWIQPKLFLYFSLRNYYFSTQVIHWPLYWPNWSNKGNKVAKSLLTWMGTFKSFQGTSVANFGFKTGNLKLGSLWRKAQKVKIVLLGHWKSKYLRTSKQSW